MKMLELIIGAIIGAGLFFGGWFARDLTKPTTIINDIDSQTTVTTEQKTQVQNYQASIQVTAVDTKGPFTNFNINIKDLSNSIKSSTTNTNYSIITTNKH